ncbi:MAG: winged helix-turn-helix transcriptional regulator [Tissierellales bacterium]|jgi:ArsR family transcriptional regulator, arsenate/arsenite/antimonite-responsive transcriptional repressor|nr:winged helix-turn-helix transcriptional regulator [Tissierellales bacterium]MBN2828464.1 winged helix-turn-helix transcriptional regulator [Tissierellales bacterium]
MINILKALADENRLRIVHLLMHYDLCVCELEVILDMNQSNVSRHLSKLRSAKIIKPLKEGQWVHYKIESGFSTENIELMSYLTHEFEKELPFVNDLARCKTYIHSSFNCQTITNDKERVSEFISNNSQQEGDNEK